MYGTAIVAFGGGNGCIKFRLIPFQDFLISPLSVLDHAEIFKPKIFLASTAKTACVSMKDWGLINLRRRGHYEGHFRVRMVQLLQGNRQVEDDGMFVIIWEAANNAEHCVPMCVHEKGPVAMDHGWQAFDVRRMTSISV